MYRFIHASDPIRWSGQRLAAICFRAGERSRQLCEAEIVLKSMVAPMLECTTNVCLKKNCK